jgi:perosamine synthetase
MSRKRSEVASALVSFVKEVYGDSFVPLHRPVFVGEEKRYLAECIDSNFVSSVGQRVIDFEKAIADYTGTKFAVATVNGTSALHISLIAAGVNRGDEVLTQSLTFVATCNALSYVGATPVFIDVDIDTLGMSPESLEVWLNCHAITEGGITRNKTTGANISACVPMHTFGLPCRIKEIVDICERWCIPVIEDAAESLGSFVDKQHTGGFGLMATLSFNGNKIITTGGGGMIVTNNEEIAKRAKHLSTTAKVAHPYEFFHDEIGYNYRLPNLNAALGCAQMEKLPKMLEIKRSVADGYRQFCRYHGLKFQDAPENTSPNFWLNALVLDSRDDRDAFLKVTNESQVMTRPIWRLMNTLPMFKSCQHDGLKNSFWLEDRVLNLPSSVPEKEFWRMRI